VTFTEAVQYFKNRGDMAQSLGITRQAMTRWIHNDKVPKLREYQIKEIVNARKDI